MNIESNIDKNKAIAIFIQFAVLTIQYLILYYFNIERNDIGILIKFISKIIVGIFFIRALKDVLHSEYKLITVTYGISTIFFLLNIIIFPQNKVSIESIVFEFFFISLPCFIYSYSIDNYNILYKIFGRVSNLVFIVGLVISFLDFFNKIDVGTYSLTLSYYLLIPALFYLYSFLNKLSIKCFILFLLSIISILLIGARGPILCIGVYVILFLINSIKGKNSVKKMLFYVISIMILIVSMIFFRNILNVFNQILEKFNIYSRTLTILLSEEIHLSGREYLYNDALELIMEHPVIGIGIAGDRYYLGNYVHNLFLEIILDFGCFIGLLFSLLLIIVFLKSIFYTNSKNANFISIFFCLGVIPLLISGSYLTSAWFWIYLGIAIRYILKNNCLKKL